MPILNVPWDRLDPIGIALVVGMILAARVLKVWVEQSGRENVETHKVIRDAVERQQETASKQHAICAENVSLNTDTNSGVRSQNKAILELLHGARIGLGQANLDEQPRRQIEERLGEAERIIREAG